MSFINDDNKPTYRLWPSRQTVSSTRSAHTRDPNMSQLIPFTKMHGLGNDFIIVNELTNKIAWQPLTITKLSDRHRGIGFDQLLIIEPSQQADFFCRIFNADGSEAEQCGNGLRCVARFIHEEGLKKQTHFAIETKAGVYPVQLENYEHICVTMGAPQVKNALVEIDVNSEVTALPISVLSVGNPHAIVKVTSLQSAIPTQLGPAIATHRLFPEGANVGFMEVLSPNHIRLRTFERGSGETFACGSNACAAVVAGITNGWLKNKVNVEFQYGNLLIEWDGKSGPIHMTGPATRVFTGETALRI